MNLFVCICRFLLDLSTPSSPPAPVYDISCIEKEQLVDLLKSLHTKQDLFGKLLHINLDILNNNFILCIFYNLNLTNACRIRGVDIQGNGIKADALYAIQVEER